jgi:bacillithiol biosynthesis deacetylase BshB1
MGEARILVFGAHPDDVEFGMGGSVLSFIDRGARVAICVLTRGESGTYGTPEVREAEMRRAAATAGAEIEILDFQDCRVADDYPSRLKLARVIRAQRPTLIFAPYHTNPHGHRDGASHPDHLATGALARAAARYARFKNIAEIEGEPWNARAILYYIVPRTMNPNLVVDVSGVMGRWEDLCRCHTTQLEIRDGKILEVLKNLRRSWGVLAGMEYAEAFHSDDPIPLDLRSFL